MRQLPSGTVTLVFTDVESSTALLRELGAERYADALAGHRRSVREAFAAHGGVEVDTQGDSFFYAFTSARAALDACAEAQRALADGPVRARMGVHTGEPLLGGEGYVGIDVHRAARIMAAGHGGQVVVSEATRGLAGDGLELVDLGPQRLKDMIAAERLHQLGPGEFPPLRTLNQTNLPATASPLVGRDREVAELRALLENGARLVTVTGPGGIGKTRLALQVAAELTDRLPDGVFWVPLAGLRDAALVPATIAQAVGATADLAAWLRGRETLVLLDNLEHLLAAAPGLGALLATAPELRLLVTSRSRLQLEAEHEYTLDPLDGAGAAELFCERARQAGAKPDVSQTVREICGRLDNLPLAIELAAGRVRLLGVEAMLARLEQRLPLLTGGRRDLPERQRTLRATIEWSYDLLTEDARGLLDRLSVFARTFSLEAAEDICEADLGGLGDLADLSLLKPVGDGRFLMLETIREYAQERLRDRGIAGEVADRHARWYLHLAEEAEGGYYTTGQADAFDRLEADHDNLRAALDRFRARRLVEPELRLAASLHDFWIARGHIAEGRARLEPALEGGDGVPDVVRAKALDAAAWLATHQLDYEAAKRFATEALGLARALGDERRVCTALCVLATVEVRYGRAAGGRALYEDALAHARNAGDDVLITHVLGSLSDLALYEDAFDEAEAYGRECLERASAGGDVWSAATALFNLGLAGHGRGDDVAATACFERCLDLALDVGAQYLVAAALDGLAALVAVERPEDAARLAGAAQEVLRRSGSALPPFEERIRSRTRRNLVERLGAERVDRLLAEGAELPLDDDLVVRYVSRR